MGYSAQSIGEWNDWTPTWTGFSANPSSIIARYTLNGKMCSVYLYCVAGTSNATTFTLTLPFTSKSVNRSLQIGQDNGGNVYSYVSTAVSTNILTCNKIVTSPSWTSSGSKFIYLSFTYEIE